MATWPSGTKCQDSAPPSAVVEKSAEVLPRGVRARSNTSYQSKERRATMMVDLEEKLLAIDKWSEVCLRLDGQKYQLLL